MELLLNHAIYRREILELHRPTRKLLWIITADIKDLHIPSNTWFARKALWLNYYTK